MSIKFVKALLLIPAFIILAILLALVIGIFILGHSSGKHQKNITYMYEFAGKEYKESKNAIHYETGNFILDYLDEKYRPLGASISSDVLTKHNFESAGMGSSCQDVDYLKLLRKDIDRNIYDNSNVCCLSNIMTDRLPIVFDKEYDHVLVMCAMSDDAHVISIGAEQFNELMNVNYFGETLYDVRMGIGK